MGGSHFWLYDWFDEHDLDDVDGAISALSSKSVLQDFREKSWMGDEDGQAPVLSDNAVFAGRGIDLSGRLHCSHPECLAKEVDELFSRVWHYFDEIVVEDTISHSVAAHWDELNADEAERDGWLAEHLWVPLHLRQVGGADLVRFRQKPPVNPVGWRDRVPAGLEPAFDRLDEFVELFVDEAVFENHVRDGVETWTFNHPLLQHTAWGHLTPDLADAGSDLEMRRRMARTVVERFAMHLAVDVAGARAVNAPLGIVTPLHREFLAPTDSPLTSSDVAFNLELPFLDGIPLETLLEIRRDERDHFERFRDSLRLAIAERIRSGSSEDPEQLADEIRKDVIEPELRKIRGRL